MRFLNQTLELGLGWIVLVTAGADGSKSSSHFDDFVTDTVSVMYRVVVIAQKEKS